METPLKRQESEVEAELKLALQETGVDLSSILESYFSKLETPVTVEKVARWFVSTRALRSQISRRKSALIDAIQSVELASEPEENVRGRLQKAGGINISSKSFSWDNLIALYGTEHVTEPDEESQNTAPPLEVNVNSGGIVYFAVFQRAGGQEAAACLKFTPSRLTTQSERLGYEIARHLGVETPQARVIRSESEEWKEITKATESLKEKNSENAKTCDEMLEALELNRCLLLMGYVDGYPLHKYEHSSLTQRKAQRIAATLGRVLLLDLVLRNEDRLPCQQLGWRGNAGNLLCTEKQPIQDPVQMRKLELKLPGKNVSTRVKRPVADDEHIMFADTSIHLVAIDSGVPRRPPALKREADKTQYPRFVEMMLNDLETASEVLGEVSREYFKPVDGKFDQVKLSNAFRSGFRAALNDMSLLRTFLLKLQRRLDHHLKQFVADINENLPSDWTPEKSSSPMSNTSSPTLNVSSSPHSISKIERRFTLKLKDFNKLAKVDDGVHDRIEHWDEVLGSEGHKLCNTHGFVTGFLEGDGQHSVVDSYELKIRIEHILERMDLITQGSETERPSQVLDSLYIGGAFAAKSFNILQQIGITHILCLCPIEVGSPDVEVLQLFQYKSCQVLDIEEEDISSHFKETSDFIQDAANKGGKTLVHCFEGKSRSPTIVLAYLMSKKDHTLLDAWNLLKSVHPRSQPNDAFMKALAELERQLHGNNSMEWKNKKPVARLCPVCQKSVGISSDSLQNHMRKFHQETHGKSKS